MGFLAFVERLANAGILFAAFMLGANTMRLIMLARGCAEADGESETGSGGDAR